MTFTDNVLNYKKHAFWIIVVAVVAVCAIVIGLAASPIKSFDLEKTRAEAMIFSTQETDLLKIGETAFDHYYSIYMGDHIPKECRITRFRLNDISLLAGDDKEFCVQIKSDYSTTGLYFLSANGNFKPNGSGGDCEGDYKEFRIKSLGNQAYQSISIGTGGGAQGLMPAEKPSPSLKFSDNDTNNFGNLFLAQEKAVDKYMAENGYKIVPNSGANAEIRLEGNLNKIKDGVDIGEYLKQCNELSKQKGLDFSGYFGKEITMLMYMIQGEKGEKGLAYNNVVLLLDKAKIIGFWTDNKITSYGLMLNMLNDSTTDTETINSTLIGQQVGSQINPYSPGVTVTQDNLTLEQIAKIVIENQLQYEEGNNYPDSNRIKDYRIKSIKIEETRITGFLFSVDYSILPATDQFILAGNGSQSDNGWINDKFHFVDVSNSDKTYNVISMATGR